jgi:hypothetical protein
VAGLCLDDIDWRAGELIIRGKGCKLERLPLPVDVGAAVTALWHAFGHSDVWPRCHWVVYAKAKRVNCLPMH